MREVSDGGSARPTDWWVLGLDSDPAPGDVDIPSMLSTSFSETADYAETVHHGLFGLLSDPALNSWLGKAGEAFYRAFEPFPQQLSAMKLSYEDAARALDAYQTVYATVQSTADGAVYDARTALEGAGLSSGDVHSLSGLGDQAYVDQLAKILIPRQTPDPPQDPNVPHPSPNAPPGYVPLNNSSPLSQGTQQVIHTCVNARKAAQGAAQDLASAAGICVKALNAAVDEALINVPWSGSAQPYGGGTFTQRFESFGGNLADLKLNPDAGQDFGKTGVSPPDSERYNACRDFIFTEINSMLASDQFKTIQSLLQQGEHPSLFNTDPGGDINAAIAAWIAMVGPGQPWDFKSKIEGVLNQHPPQPGETHQYTRFDEDPNAELYQNLWANISYGYVGMAAGFDAGTLQHGAELNAYLSKTNTQGNYVGRQIGIDLYTHYKPGQLTQQAIDDEIYAHLDQLRPYSEFQDFPSPLQQPPSDWKGGDFPNSPVKVT